ncbi:SDR family oxidoreductase [uncultured Methylobacterium sp.]|uniref:SDR family oxidoreductase n=1 Tax=uncultured Methylobacterium sp. TaxID=157278 RepID=UPI002636764F|nr:SDR family oxidoreductase [uncultured Methylobacterium sp.]
MRLADKVAVVTGGGSGIGAATARLFAREGARVALVDRDAEGALACAAAIRAEGGAALVRVSDVGDPDTSLADAAVVAEAFGGIDIVVTAAGFSCGGTVETTAPADWDAVFRANVGGTWLWARAALPHLRARGGGSLVTVASQLALAGGRGNSAYIAAKGAILSLTRTMALDFAPDRIRVNALVPGAIETPMLARSFRRNADPDAARAASRARHPLGRLGLADEVARAALFLAGDESSFTTGTTLAVDGGWLCA